jgi:hypothetical protein
MFSKINILIFCILFMGNIFSQNSSKEKYYKIVDFICNNEIWINSYTLYPKPTENKRFSTEKLWIDTKRCGFSWNREIAFYLYLSEYPKDTILIYGPRIDLYLTLLDAEKKAGTNILPKHVQKELNDILNKKYGRTDNLELDKNIWIASFSITFKNAITVYLHKEFHFISLIFVFDPQDRIKNVDISYWNPCFF